MGHIAHSAICHALSNGLVPGIDLNMKFCEACAKAKLACQLFSKELETWAEKFGKRVHWDLWGPASVKSLNGNQYVAAQIDDVM